MNIEEVISTNIRVSILRRKTTQRILADRLGMTLPALQNRLSGRVEWRVKEVELAALVLETELCELLRVDATPVQHQEAVGAQ
ncbi:hypothetical protein [Rothia nasisuis]|uniref:hypothetical protein n=1 Tax=Rothia nasisuis TaxID=2109647 RepID=UPI001F181B15|nr:hypothetical protein [Rothia nasisuis]